MLPTSPPWSSGAREGDARSVARLISLVEDASPALREVAAALAPHTGRAQVLGLTGSPGRRQVDDDDGAGARAAAGRASASACSPSTRRRRSPAGALLGDRVRMQDHAGDDGVFIRSMASRGHLGGLAWATPQALRVLDAAGCDVVLIETVGVGQSELEIASLADTTLVLVAPGMGDGIQAAKAGILEVADVFVVNKADRDGADSRRCATCATCSPSAAGTPSPARWRPPICRTVASRDTDNGIDEVLARIAEHRDVAGVLRGGPPPARPSGPPARSRRSPWPRSARGSATCAARRRSGRWPNAWWRGRPTPTRRPTSWSPGSEAPAGRTGRSAAPTAGSTGSRCSAAGR